MSPTKREKMNTEILNRKGARKVVDIPSKVLELLNTGEIETVNLTEWLAIDHVKLIQNTFEGIGISKEVIQEIAEKISTQKKPSTMNSVKLAGSLLFEKLKSTTNFQLIIKNLSTHNADSIRCYAPYLTSLNSSLNIEAKLNQVKALVADHHFGVREVVWMALRPEIDKNLKESIKILSSWAEDENENIRRFTTESTRPRGVWCKHIDTLKESPELALTILEKLKADQSKYVQDSVGNWLNDASKSKPDFVIKLCDEWKETSPTNETKKIIKRARRTIDKQ